MKIIIEEIRIEELVKILNIYIHNNKNEFNNTFKQQCINMIQKLTIDTKKRFIKNHLLTFYLKSSTSISNKLTINSIVNIKNEKLAYIYYKCIDEVYEIDTNTEDYINILKSNYNKESCELEEYLDVISSMFFYTTNENSKSLSINKIDKILTNNKIAKNVINSITSVLTSRKDDNYFRKHKDTNKRIVTIEELNKYLNISDKYSNIECPKCSKIIRITKENINKVIAFNKKDKKVQIICSHEQTLYLKEMPYSLYLNQYLDNNTKTEHVSMFVLNNFDLLVNKFKIFNKLRIVSKSSKIVKLNELINYFDFKDKYIFLDYNFTTNYKDKVKVNEKNLNKIFEVNKVEEKVFINILENFNDNKYYKKVGFIYIDNILDDMNDSKATDVNIALTVIHNFKLLKIKNLINIIKED